MTVINYSRNSKMTPEWNKQGNPFFCYVYFIRLFMLTITASPFKVNVWFFLHHVACKLNKNDDIPHVTVKELNICQQVKLMCCKKKYLASVKTFLKNFDKDQTVNNELRGSPKLVKGSGHPRLTGVYVE